MFRKLLIFEISLLVLSLAACNPASLAVPTSTIDPAALKTAAARTASAYMTATALAVPTQTATATPGLSQTAAAQTLSASQTQAAAVTMTPTTQVALTQDPSLIDRATYVKDVTVPDGTDFKPGEAFTKTWRLQNNGTTTWNSTYAFVFITGDKMGGPDKVSLAENVPPGSQVDLSVKLVAPAQPGKYRGYWKMVNPSLKFFDDPVYVEIDVVSGTVVPPAGTPGTPTVTATAPSGATPTATTGAVTISSLLMSVDTTSFTGTCPHTFTYTARFTLSTPASVSYRIEAGSDTPGFTFTLPAPQTESLPAGEIVRTFSLEMTQSVTGWTRLHITAPSDVASNQAAFSLTCQP